MQFAEDAEVWGLVQKLEQCELGPGEFHHANHLAVGMAYLVASGSVEAALAQMRATLTRYLACLGKVGYHETMTRFWLLRLDEVRQANPGMALHRLCTVAAEALGNKDLVFEYYDQEALMSDEARARWVEPGRHPILVRAPRGANVECPE